MSRILKPFDANYSGNISLQSFRDRGAKIRIALPPQKERWALKAPKAINRPESLQIVISIQLPFQKSAEPHPAFCSSQAGAKEPLYVFVGKAVGLVHGNVEKTSLDQQCSNSEAEEWRGERGCDQFDVQAFRLAWPLIARLGIGEDYRAEPLRMVFHHELDDSSAVFMTDELRSIDPKLVQQAHNHLHLVRKSIIVIQRNNRVPETEQIRRNYPVSARQQRNDLVIFKRLEWTSMQQHDRVANPAIDVSDPPEADISEFFAA